MAAGRNAGKKAAKTPASEAIQVGGQLGPYEIQELEGKGAFGVVYRAYHPGLDRMVAIRWDSCAGLVHALLEALRQRAVAAPPPTTPLPATSLPGDSSWRPAAWHPDEWSE